MKGFIEVRDVHSHQPRLINVSWIAEIIDSFVNLAYHEPDALENEYIKTDETYEQLVTKIKEAMK